MSDLCPWYDLGSHTLTAPCTVVGGAVCSTPNTAFFSHLENHGVIARAGLSYHFGVGPSMVGH
jgi:hypothetical protein